MVSQAIDSITVISVTFGASLLAGEMGHQVFFALIFYNYLFKLVVALAGTLPFYGISHLLQEYLAIDPKALNTSNQRYSRCPRLA